MKANPAPIDDGPDCDGSTACPADIDVHDEGCHALAAIAAVWAVDDIEANRAGRAVSGGAAAVEDGWHKRDIMAQRDALRVTLRRVVALLDDPYSARGPGFDGDQDVVLASHLLDALRRHPAGSF